MADHARSEQHRSRWIWVSALLAVAAVGLLVWALTATSDRDSARDELASTSQQLASSNQELDATKKELEASQQQVEELESEGTSDRRRRVVGALGAAGGLAAAKSVYEDLAEQLGTSEEELGTTEEQLDTAEEELDATAAQLEATQEELETATEAAEDAAADAEAAKRQAAQADTTADKAQAETDQAKAEAEAATTKSTVVAACVRAYVTAFGELFEGDGARAQAAGVRKQFADITSECKGALADA